MQLWGDLRVSDDAVVFCAGGADAGERDFQRCVDLEGYVSSLSLNLFLFI